MGNVFKPTYYDLVAIIKHVCLKHPAVNNFYTNRYKLNSVSDIEYAAVIFTNNSIQVGDSETTLSFNLLYADRLTRDRDNTLQIQSEGISVLTEIINAIRNIDFLSASTTNDITINVFYEQFADSTAGAIAQVSLVYPSNLDSCDWLGEIDYTCCNYG